MPTRYRMVFNGCSMVRRKIETKRGKQEVVTPGKHEKESETKGSGIAAAPVEDKKALQAKLRAELFKSL